MAFHCIIHLFHLSLQPSPGWNAGLSLICHLSYWICCVKGAGEAGEGGHFVFAFKTVVQQQTQCVEPHTLKGVCECVCVCVFPLF